MSTLSEESRQIVASLAHRVGPNADTARIAHAIISILQDIEATLTPVIGQQGVAALYRRSLHLWVYLSASGQYLRQGAARPGTDGP